MAGRQGGFAERRPRACLLVTCHLIRQRGSPLSANFRTKKTSARIDFLQVTQVTPFVDHQFSIYYPFIIHAIIL